MQIISWNVNSIKKRLNDVVELLQQKSPDVLLLQELKCIEESFPFFEIESLGYNVKLKGEKTYNGVACISRHNIELVTDKLIEGDNQARYLECFIIVGSKALRVINVYVPNGASLDSESFHYKGKFFDALYDKIKQCLNFDEPLIVAGDYNVALDNIDVYSPKMLADSVCFHISMRRKMRALLGLGMQDAFRVLHPAQQNFSWWDYRGRQWEQNKGMRLDYILLSPLAADLLMHADIETDWRGRPEPSDHVPVVCQFRM